jgi:serine-type D-Ala-D-Ala carboxypeptidase (penicillin-binding protein 5/6)
MRRLALILALVVAFWSGGQARAATPVPWISAPEGIVIDGWTGGVLYAKNANVVREPASTVKIMTALVVLRHRIPLDRVVTVSPLAASYGGSTAYLYAGERLTVRNLLYGALLPSGNDAAVALAQTVTPYLATFVGLMNAQAARLGLRHTHYLTPNGFDTYGQVTTARDLALLARAAMRWHVFDTIVATRVWVARSADGRTVHRWTNLNTLLWRDGAVNGVKTGTTTGAGACLVSSAQKSGKWILEVNMGSTEASRFADGASLLRYGFAVDSSLPSTR